MDSMRCVVHISIILVLKSTNIVGNFYDQPGVCSFSYLSTCSRDDSGPYWYYNKYHGQCTEIPNGKCSNKKNNFWSRTECEAYCSRDRVCKPLVYSFRMRCMALFYHWTYNARTDACEMFVYGGCDGSANNFKSKEACDRKCLVQVSRGGSFHVLLRHNFVLLGLCICITTKTVTDCICNACIFMTRYFLLLIKKMQRHVPSGFFCFLEKKGGDTYLEG